MGSADNLKSIISRQREVLSELEGELHAIESSDLVQENTGLKAELEKLRMDFEQISKNASIITDENTRLKNALYEQIFNEKVRIVDNTEKRLNFYFSDNTYWEINKLAVFERNVKERINSISRALVQNNIAVQDEIYARLAELSALLVRKVTEARENAAQISRALSQKEHDELESLKNEQITDEQIRAVTKKNNFERFVGLNVLNVVGIFLLVVGAIALARFTYMRLTDLLRGILLFALGGAMLIAGGILNRKKPNIFSLGISAGGIGILYAALATSYFGLHILDIYSAVIVCVIITALAFILSTRYNSQTIAAFAMIGGYLPMFSISSNVVVAYGAMVYFIALNLLALLISFSKKWRVSSFIGLSLNIIGTFYVISIFYGTNDVLEKIFATLYVLFAFLVYTSITIISTYRTKARFRKSDVVLLAINTFFSSIAMYWEFYCIDFQDYNGLLAVAFAAIYLLLGKLIEKKFAGEERHTKALFYLTGLTFIVLIVPLQFGRVWLSLGWLIEGVLLAAYGILKSEKRFRLIGYIISLLCLGAFITFDIFGFAWRGYYHYLFVYKYLAITLGSLIILGAYMYKKMMTGRFVGIYKYFALANVWVFAIYLIVEILWPAVGKAFGSQTVYQVNYLMSAAVVVTTFFLAYTFSRIKLISDLGIKIMSVALYAVGIIILFVINSAMMPVAVAYFHTGTPAFGVTIVGTAILFVLGMLSVLALRDLLKLIVMKRKLGIEWYPLIISGYFVIILTQNLITQYYLSFSNAAFSIIYVLTALAWIIFGFARRYSFIRKFGLGLALLSVAKLFLIDLFSLTQGFKIITYFALGITLIAISYVYQYFNKRLELKEAQNS